MCAGSIVVEEAVGSNFARSGALCTPAALPSEKSVP
jgi:hypothetical protein